MSRIIASFNGHDVMAVKAAGKFVQHSHPETDDFFLVPEGKLTIALCGGNVQLGPGDLCIVPRGVAHRPIAQDELHRLLIEPAGTPNTRDRPTAAAKVAIREATDRIATHLDRHHRRRAGPSEHKPIERVVPAHSVGNPLRARWSTIPDRRRPWILRGPRSAGSIHYEFLCASGVSGADKPPRSS